MQLEWERKLPSHDEPRAAETQPMERGVYAPSPSESRRGSDHAHTSHAKRHRFRAPNSSRSARIPERGRPARSSYAPARTPQISNAPAPMMPLRPGRPRSVGCSFAALYYNPAKSSRAARISPGARLCARSTSRSRLTAREASDFHGRPRRSGAAAAGPRRTQPRSLGCGSAALDSSCSRGPSDLARLNSHGLTPTCRRPFPRSEASVTGWDPSGVFVRASFAARGAAPTAPPAPRTPCRTHRRAVCNTSAPASVPRAAAGGGRS